MLTYAVIFSPSEKMVRMRSVGMIQRLVPMGREVRQEKKM